MHFKNTFTLSLAIFALVGCKEIGSNDDPGLTKACTLMGSSTAIRVHATSSTPLPANLALSLNGSDLDADECSNSGAFASSVEVNADRTQATVIFQLNGNQEDYDFYFPNGSTQPQSNVVNLGFFARATCADTAVKFDEVLNAQATWEPVYANGKDCGTTSHVGDLSVQAQ